jgi:hypothetical protein
LAYRLRVYCDFDWVPDGAAGAALGQSQANNPGFAAALNPGAVGNAQTLRLQVAESVPGGDSPTGANFNTALSSAATDLGTLLTTAGAFSGGAATPLTLIQAWSTGGP